MTHGWYQWEGGRSVGFVCVCVIGCVCVAVVSVCAGVYCEKAQEWAADLASNECGALQSEQVSVGGESHPEAEPKGEKT